MKVKELIEQLQKCDQEKPVYFMNTKFGCCEVGEINNTIFVDTITDIKLPVILISEFQYFESNS